MTTERKPTLNPNLKEFWKTRVLPDGQPVVGRVLYGGRMSSKSHDAAGVAIARANHHEERFLCTRMFQNRIADSVYTLLKDKIEYFGLQSNFKIYADAIEHKFNGSLFRFYGIARNIDEIKSFERATVWWNEESHNLTKEMFTTIRPTVMRNDGAEMWFTLNPRLESDYSYQRLIANPPEGFLTREINYPENPFLGESALRDIEKEFEEDYEDAAHIYLGVPLSNDSAAVIKRLWIKSAIDAHLTVVPESGQWSGNKTLGYDIADDGDDTNAITVVDGSIITHAEEWKADENELFKSAKKALGIAKANGCHDIGYDSIGVGSGTGSTLNELKFRSHFKFNAASKVSNPKKFHDRAAKITNEDFFSNLKAQAWWNLAERFRKTYLAVTKGYKFPADEMISLSSGIEKKVLDKLITELSTPKKDFDNQGKVKVESKKDLSKRGIVSPNIADSAIIATSKALNKRIKASEVL